MNGVLQNCSLEVSRGLAELHQQDIVHRDLKPSNILYDARGRAKVAGPWVGADPGRLQPALTVGQPGSTFRRHARLYEPEQEKQTDYLRPASDVYALGVVLFEALTGRNYHNLAPGTRLSSLRSDVPGWLDELLERMLQKDLEQRPWDGNVLLGLVEQAVQGRMHDNGRQRWSARQRKRKPGVKRKSSSAGRPKRSGKSSWQSSSAWKRKKKPGR